MNVFKLTSHITTRHRRIVLCPDDITTVAEAYAYAQEHLGATTFVYNEDITDDELIEDESELDKSYCIGRGFILTLSAPDEMPCAQAYIHQIDFLDICNNGDGISRSFLRKIHRDNKDVEMREYLWTLDIVNVEDIEEMFITKLLEYNKLGIINKLRDAVDRYQLGITNHLPDTFTSSLRLQPTPRIIEGDSDTRNAEIATLCGDIVYCWYMDLLGNSILF